MADRNETKTKTRLSLQMNEGRDRIPVKWEQGSVRLSPEAAHGAALVLLGSGNNLPIRPR